MLPDDPRKPVPRRILRAQQQIFALQFLLLRRALHQQLQMVQVHGLLQKIERAIFHGGDSFFHRPIRGQQKYGNRGVGLFRFPQNIQPRCSRHLQIRDHQQIPARAHLLDRGRAVRRFVHGVPRALQGLSHHRAQFALVFNEKERFHLFRFYHESAGLQGTTEQTCAEKGSIALPQTINKIC